MVGYRTILTAIALLAASAPAQVFNRIGQRTTGGATIGMGTVQENPQQKRERMQRSYDEDMKQAREDFAKKQWQWSRQELEDALTVADKSQIAAVRDMLVQLELEGRREMKLADADFQQHKYSQALRAYRRISARFGRLPSGVEARQAIKKAAHDPNVQAALQAAKANALDQMIQKVIAGHFALARRQGQHEAPAAAGPERPRTQPASAPATAPADSTPAAKAAPDRVAQLKQLDPAELARAVRLMTSLAKAYPASAAGKRAAADLDALRADPAVKARLAGFAADRAPERAFNIAETYRKAGLKAKALELYRHVVQKYPDSEQAAKAKAMIVVLQTQVPRQ